MFCWMFSRAVLITIATINNNASKVSKVPKPLKYEGVLFAIGKNTWEYDHGHMNKVEIALYFFIVFFKKIWNNF